MVLSRQFLIPPRSRMIQPVGMGSKPMGLKRAIMPIAVKKPLMAQKMGISGSGGVLLLSKDLGSADENAQLGGRIRTTGGGFGVKTPNKSLLAKLDNVSIGKPTRKNVSISF
jgi:hypothetical protein